VTVSAYVLIQTEVGKAATVTSTVRAIAGVRTAETVIGPYDAIIRVEGDAMDDVARTIVSQIQLIDGITRTLTCEIVHI